MIKEIKFTDNALKQIGNLLSKKDKGSFFRIAIKGGGCSGFQYEFTFDQSKNDDDLNYENILIDKTSADLLKGSEVDYVSELIGGVASRCQFVVPTMLGDPRTFCCDHLST